ncbi:MAG: sigma-70 family RNA polymerase sigma factor [Deltaproteobacteria bacterium]|nr:sigma-70 family RNA polymerase sigma factor [Deltaproteobacteria bacterium]
MKTPDHSLEQETGEITQLLQEWRASSPGADDKLLAAVYDELHYLARRYLRRERSDHSLEATALIHEAYLRFRDQQDTPWQNRSHFFAVAAQAMRRILIDHARAKLYQKRGAGRRAESLEDLPFLTNHRAPELIALDDGLTALARIDPVKAKLVELRFFAGFSLEETASILGCSRATASRHWRLAQTWLYREMQPKESP